MASFFAFLPTAFQTDAFQQGGQGVTRRGGKLPWWARQENFLKLLDEERRLERERALAATAPTKPEREDATALAAELQSRLERQAQALLRDLRSAPRPAPKPQPAQDPLVRALTGPFQHLLRTPAAPPRAAPVGDHTPDELAFITDAIEAIEAVEQHLALQEA